MKLQKLANVADIIAGQSPPSSTYNREGIGIPFFQGKADYGEKYPSVRYWCSKPTKIALPDDILISMRAPVGPVNINIVESCIGRGLSAIRVKKNVSRDYIYFWLKLNQNIISAKETGSTFKAITQKILNEIVVPFPIYEVQLHIANLLTKAENLISQRKESIRLLDEFLKSTFLEMFGDIKAKKSHFRWEKLRPYLKAESGKSSKNVIVEYQTDFPIYGGNGINGWSNKPLYRVPIIIAGRVGQQCGVIHSTKEPCWVTDNAIVLSILNKDKLNLTYLATAYSNSPILEKVKRLDLPFINQSMLLDIELPIPPIELQTQFAQIVEKTETLKTQYQQSLQELENLYGSLSQQAFRGELGLKDQE